MRVQSIPLLTATIFGTLLILLLFLQRYPQEYERNSIDSEFNSFLGTEIGELDEKYLSNTQTIIVIPGGGSGLSKSSFVANKTTVGLPEWTKRRLKAASEYYHSLTNKEQEQTIFLTLSAGSLNAPSGRLSDERIIFECTPMIDYLKESNIPSSKIFGDFFSWDTISNGLSLRLFLDGLKSFNQRSKTIRIEVFISDFHLLRVQAALEWVLSLEPSYTSSKSLTRTQLNMHDVSSHGIDGFGPEELQARAVHEKKGVEQIQSNARIVRTWEQFLSFMMFGGHVGIRKYLFQQYSSSRGVGW